MGLLLYPRAAPGDRLRVWVGATGRTRSPALTWALEEKGGGQVALAAGQPTALRAIKSVRPDGTDGQTAMVDVNEPRVFAGVYEFTGLRPATRYVVNVRAEDNGEMRSLQVRTLPAAVPGGFDETFNVLLVSCFHQKEDPVGLVGVGASRLTGPDEPHLTLLLGDQVYLDLPSDFHFPDTEAGLAADFERKYLDNWGGLDGYSRVLSIAPSVSAPDDHEYWNNYPHKFPFVLNTETETGRKRWEAAARKLYEGFQFPFSAPEGTGQFNRLGGAAEIDVPPLSFFIADTRSLRDRNFKYVIHPDMLPQLERWVDRVVKDKLYGVFVSGQSLFRKEPATLGILQGHLQNKLLGKVGDYELSQYKDFGKIMQQLARLADANLPLVCITGDVHFGRFVSATDQPRMTGRAALYEIISSPASLVTTRVVDELKVARAGKSDPWPRHSDADQPPEFLAKRALGGRFACKLLDKQRGNHVALLSFRATGGRNLEARLKFYPLHSTSALAAPREAQASPLVLAPLS
jgi:hypothetical protein